MIMLQEVKHMEERIKQLEEQYKALEERMANYEYRQRYWSMPLMAQLEEDKRWDYKPIEERR